MAKWDLFIDESGSFQEFDGNEDNRKEDSLVGGFVCPRGTFDEETGEQWLQEIVERFRQNPSYVKEMGTYEPRHAYKNKGDIKRQMMLDQLSIFKEKIAKIGGMVVLFYNPSQEIGVKNESGIPDNTELYVVMTGMGILRTLDSLRRRDLQNRDEETELYCHIAIRTNMNEKSADTVVLQLRSGVANSTIKMQSYVSSIESAARMRANGRLRDYSGYKSLFDGEHIEIMTGGEKARTVPCDFISHCYRKVLHGVCPNWQKDKRWKKVYDKQDSLIFDVFESGKVILCDIAYMDLYHNYAEVFTRLLQSGFPEEMKESFFEMLNKADGIQMQGFVDQVVAYFNVPCRNAAQVGNIQEMIEATQRVINMCGSIKISRFACELRANMYLYQDAMYTHLGDGINVNRVETAFLEDMKGLTDQYRSDKLLTMYYNRKIVDYTDCFRYETGDEIFTKYLDPYWQNVLIASKALMSGERKLSSEEYGREIGSYLQLIRHRMRVSTEEARNKYDALVKEYYFPECEEQFSNPADLSRYHQNACEIEMEMGRFDSAFAHICCAVVYEDGEAALPFKRDRIVFNEKRCKNILKLTGMCGQEYPWIYYHYIHLANELKYRENEMWETMIKVCVTDDFDIQDFNVIRNIFLRALIQWRLAPLLFSISGRDGVKRGMELFNAAAQTLSDMNSATFSAIAVSVRAEFVSELMMLDKLDEANRQKTMMLAEYGKMKSLIERLKGENPFLRDGSSGYIDMTTTPEDAKTSDDYMKISRVISY